jgi:hypothetical protein
MPTVGFDLITLLFDQTETLHVPDGALTVINPEYYVYCVKEKNRIKMYGEHFINFIIYAKYKCASSFHKSNAGVLTSMS